MKHFRLWGLILPVCLSACVAKPQMINPNLSEDEKTNIHFYNKSPVGGLFRVYEKDDCTVPAYIQPIFLKGYGEQTFNVERNKPFTFFMAYIKPKVSVVEFCHLVSTLNPESSAYDIDLIMTDEGCGLTAQKQTPLGKMPVEGYKFIPREGIQPFFSSGPFCR